MERRRVFSVKCKNVEKDGFRVNESESKIVIINLINY